MKDHPLYIEHKPQDFQETGGIGAIILDQTPSLDSIFWVESYILKLWAFIYSSVWHLQKCNLIYLINKLVEIQHKWLHDNIHRSRLCLINSNKQNPLTNSTTILLHRHYNHEPATAVPSIPVHTLQLHRLSSNPTDPDPATTEPNRGRLHGQFQHNPQSRFPWQPRQSPTDQSFYNQQAKYSDFTISIAANRHRQDNSITRDNDSDNDGR